MSNKYLKNVKFWYVIVFFLIYMLVCFLIPSLINGNNTQFSNGKIQKQQVKLVDTTKKEDNVNLNKKIKLLLTDINQVVELNLDDYLKGVLIGEVPITYELEALKAQAVVARTYTLNKLKNTNSKHAFGADMCDDIHCCQAYKTKEYAFNSWDDNEENEKWAKLEKAVNNTSNEVITYNGELINAFFHAHSGGMTENVKYLWSKREMPYLVSVAGNEGYVYQDLKSFTSAELKEALKSDVPMSSENIELEIKDYTGSGRVNNMLVNGVVMDSTRFRSLTGIKSTNFRIEKSGDNISFYTVGYGHGVGMSQEGANQMAIDGKNYKEIIQHYYTGVKIENIDENVRIRSRLKNLLYVYMNNILILVNNTFICCIWRCFFMIMHSDKKIICVKDIPSNIIDEAIFILKENVMENQKEKNEERNKEIILNEAEEIVEDYISKIQEDEEKEIEAKIINYAALIKEVIYVCGLLIILAICIATVI